MKSLKNILTINALSSGATGLGLISFSTSIADLFGTTSSGAIVEVGLFLVLFGAFVLFQALKGTLSPKGITTIIVLDILWVGLSILVLLFKLFNLSAIGYFAIAGVAVWVAAMAYFQIKGLRKLLY